VPSVLVDALIYDGGRLYEAVRAHLGGLAAQHGVDALPDPADTVTALPPSLVGARPGRPMRYVPAGGDGAVPEGLGLDGGRPAVLVSRSTTDDPRPDRMMTRVVEAARDADVHVILVRPDRAVSRRALPPNVTTTDWLPFGAVMPRLAGVVTHGGSGTVMAALAAGVPQLVVPGSGDRTLHARLIAERGAGLAVPAKEITGSHLERLVSDPQLQQVSREVAAEIAALPPPSDLVEPLVALTH
jgi:UDP:flavonoid glycosyltransferase YjiC (YdhE family)